MHTSGMKAALTSGVLALVATAACNDSLGPPTWDPTPATTVIYSLSRPDLVGKPSAYDFVGLRRLVIEAPGSTGGWDIALAEQSGNFVFLPVGMFPGIDDDVLVAETTARIMANVKKAPSDTTEYSRGPIPVRRGEVYIVRTRQESCVTFGRGPFYAKFQVLSVDPSLGSVELAAIRNPYCTDRALTPPIN